MSTTRFRARRLPAVATCALLLAGGCVGLSRIASASATTTADATADTTAPAPALVAPPIEAVSQPATALAKARRMSIDGKKPIFPMQVEPLCYILDNFGDARSGGRSHEGTDMLAHLGQEVYAVVDGTLGNQVIDGQPGSELSGNGWRLYATGSKTYYVFMHLSAFAEGLHNGSVVKQGQVIGFVGDTGNPGPGNYHLHFEVHPDGGAAINALRVLTIPPGCSVA